MPAVAGLDPSKADPNAKNTKKVPRRMTDDDLCDDFDFDMSDQNNGSDDDGEGSGVWERSLDNVFALRLKLNVLASFYGQRLESRRC